jgi:HD superfamily phosphohydrolase
MTRGNSVPDPIHGSIEMPNWLMKISREKSVRRMLFIRQLGLKAYVDYPGAIHPRYSHVLGVMHLSGRIVDLLTDLENKNGRREVADTLNQNKENIMAAGFLHDIAHGPFSHVVDYVLKKYSKKTHETIAGEIIRKLEVLEDYGISLNAVEKIITGEHDYPFISGIINGQLDADKLDYLLRDAHNVGLKYSLDLDHFIRNFRILGVDTSNLGQCELGLDKDDEAIVTSEMFITIWKSMYDLVYHVKSSRIAEKMLEKALILRAEKDTEFRSVFKDINKFIELDDEKLLERLKKGTGPSANLAEWVRDNKLYDIKYDGELTTNTFDMSDRFVKDLQSEPDALSDFLSLEMHDRMKCKKYQVICDIVKSRSPKPIHIDEYDESGEPIELKSKSDIVDAIRSKIRLKVYVDPQLKKNADKDFISKTLKKIISD